MRIQYLGTSATERIPAMFCECEVCENSRKAGGRNIRTRSQALIDDKILIDFPSDTYEHFLKYNVPFKKIRNCILTHSHMDHLYKEEVTLKKRRFAYVYEDERPLVFYSDKAGYEAIRKIRTDCQIPEEDFSEKLIAHYKPLDIEGYTVTPLKAVHDPSSSPVIYIIEKDGKSIFYSTDTSEYDEETFSYLKTLEKPLNLITLDCTYGLSDTEWSGHLDFRRCINLRKKLEEAKITDSNTIFVLTHFSHNAKSVMYDEFVKIAAEENFWVAYDGMIIEI